MRENQNDYLQLSNQKMWTYLYIEVLDNLRFYDNFYFLICMPMIHEAVMVVLNWP